MIDRIVLFLRQWRRLFQATEALLIDNISATAPWLAPIPSAYMLYDAMHRVLAFPTWVALTGGLVAELLGLSAVTTVIGLWEYNENARAKDQRAPVAVALLTAAFYLAVVLTVNAMLDDAPIIHKVSKGLLSSLSVCAGIILALRSGQARRIQSIEEERIERKKAAQEARNLPQVTPVVTQLIKRDWRELSIEERDRVGSLSVREIVNQYGLPERTAQAWAQRARSNGYHKEGE